MAPLKRKSPMAKTPIAKTVASLFRATALVSAIALIPVTTAGLAAVDAKTGPEFTRLMAIYGAVPALLMAIGAFCLRGFPITRERQAAVRAEIDTAVASRTGVGR